MFHDRLVGQDPRLRVARHRADHRTGMPRRLPSLKVALSARTQVHVYIIVFLEVSEAGYLPVVQCSAEPYSVQDMVLACGWLA